MKTYRFRPGWAASLATLVLLPVFVSLGFWQLQRADEKRAIMAQREQRESLPVLPAKGAEWASAENRYRRIELSGEFDAAHQFLLDNQVHSGRVGYHVLTPLRISGSDAAVLVNRGWVPAGEDRRHLPELPLTLTSVGITGLVDKFPGIGLKLKGAEIPSPGWPSVVQTLDAASLSERLGYRLLAYQVLLGPDQSQGYLRDWRPVDLKPERNQGYAMQWFFFALALSILYIRYGFKPKSKN